MAEIWGNRGGIARNPDNEVNGGIVGAKLETRNNGRRMEGASFLLRVGGFAESNIRQS